MSTDPESSSTAPKGRGRGQSRGRSRGGYGKAMRSRGRRGGGRAAEFHQRLTLEGDKAIELDPESEEAKEMAIKFARRQLGTNADRYKEPEPELNSDGEVDVEPEVDLSSFLEKQRLGDDGTGPSLARRDSADDNDVDRTLVRLVPRALGVGESSSSFKGKLELIEVDDELETMLREKEEADANRELKSRFKAKVEIQKTRGSQTALKQSKTKDTTREAPPLPDTGPKKTEKEQLEDYLDDLLC